MPRRLDDEYEVHRILLVLLPCSTIRPSHDHMPEERNGFLYLTSINPTFQDYPLVRRFDE